VIPELADMDKLYKPSVSRAQLNVVAKGFRLIVDCIALEIKYGTVDKATGERHLDLIPPESPPVSNPSDV
jgi:hypothetical protein